MSSPESHGTSSLGGLHDLLDPAFDHDEGEVVRAPEKAPSSKKRLMNDDEDEDEEIDVEESSGDEYEYESPSTNNNNNNHYKAPPMTNYSSPSRRRTRSCAVPDVLKTKEVVTLDDLMKHGFLRPGDTLEFSGLGDTIETGILVKDGWIEYGTDKYPDMDAWVIRVFKDNKRRRKNVDCWETVSARHHALSFHRDQFLNKMNNRVNYNDRKKRLREERKKMAGGGKGGTRHQVPGRSRLVHKESQQASINHNMNDDEDEEVMIDDEPSTSNAIVLPHKKRKTNYSKHVPANDEKPASSSSSVDLLGDMSGPSALLREDTELLPDAHEYVVKAKEKNSAWLGKRKKDDGNDAPSTPPQTKPNKEKTKKETKQSPLLRRRTETQAQDMDDDKDEDIGVRASPEKEKEKEEEAQEEKEDNDETRDEEDAKESGDTDATRDDEDPGDNDETRDEEGEEGEDEGEATHDSVASASASASAPAPAHAQKDLPQPPSGKQQLQHITSPSSPDSTNASSSSAEMNVWSDKSKSTFDSSMGSFAARLDEHEKEVETLSTKKLSQTKTKQTSPQPTPVQLKPTSSIPPKSPSTSKPPAPPKASAKPTPSIPSSSKTPLSSSASSLPPTPSSTKASSLHPPKFTLPPSSESVSPIASTSTPTIPTTPITPSSSATSSFTTPSAARKPAQSVVFTPARPPSAQSMPVSPSAICKDGQERIILTTGLRSDMLCTLQALMAQLGGRTVDEFDDTQGARVTHVVTGLTAGDDTHRAQRTLKYCCGVLCGAWIVSFEWVLESLAAREWVEESDFELRGDTHGAGAPKKARIALRKGTQRLFTGLRICFAGDFTQPSRKDLQRVARIGGADILATLPSPTTTMPEYLAEVKHTHVVIDPERTDTAAAQELHLVCGLVPLSYHWLLDSVSHYAVQAFDKYRIVVQEEGRGYETQQSLEF